jgi:riboflavin kinase / FMN adenylyltransferase
MAIHCVRWNTPFPDACRHGALTIGNFDGVHRGHQALLAELQRQAQLVHGPAVAMTFDPPPSQLLRPGTLPAVLTTVTDRAMLMQAQGADHVLILETTHELLQHTAREFFETVVVGSVAAHAVVPGFNFAFGHNREGTVERMLAFCHERGLACVPVPPLQLGGQPVSSSRIRAELLAGNVAGAAQLLGRPHRVRGRVVTGQRRGQTLGIPTANLEQVPTLIPGNGVYAVRALVDARLWPGAANVGANPTFGEHARKLEVHLIGYHGDLYGAELAVDFVERLRETRKFSGVDELVRQLQADIAAAQRLLQGPC